MKDQLCTVELQKSSGHKGKPQNHKLFTIPVCGLLLCSPIGFLIGKNSTRVSRVHFFSGFLFKVTNKPPMIRTNRNTVERESILSREHHECSQDF